MTDVCLKLAKLGDAPRIAAMSRTLIEDGLPWSWTPRRVAAHMKQRENLSVIATRGADLAGFIMAQFGDESVHIALLGVGRHHQRSGLGRQLVRWVEESATTAGLFRMKLEFRASNHAARRFYTALGYSEAGRAPGYYSGVEDAIRFTKALGVTTRASREG